MKKRNLFERMIAAALAFVLAIPAGLSSVATSAAAVETESEPISISLEWKESEFKNGTQFNLKEEDGVRNVVKMNVGYESSLIREEGYAPGELVITVKGIGNVNRASAKEATVGADKESDSVKVRDWSYTWNRASDIYTLTNNEAIEGNSVFSGYFELVWEIDARDSIHGYSQNDMQATLYLPDGSSVSSNTLSFTNTTKADTFAVHIDRHEMYSYEGLTAGIPNPKDYAFVRYNLGASDYKNSRGLQGSYYQFDPDALNIGSGVIVISPVLACTDRGDGTYTLGMSSGNKMEEQYVFAAYPKSQYTDKTVTASITKYGNYYEGDDAGKTGILQLAIDTIDVPVPADFSFSDIPGDIYEFWKDTYYDQNVSSSETQSKGGDIIGSKMESGTTETFYLEGFVNNKHFSKYNLEIVDDFLYILQNDGTFRQLEDGEYAFTGVTVPGTNSLLNINNIPLQKDVYRAAVYTACNGETISTNGIPAWEGLITETSQYVDLTGLSGEPTAIAVIIYGIEESIGEYSIPVKVRFHTSGENDNLTSGQVVNTSFIKIYNEQTDGVYDWFNDSFTEDNYHDDTNLNLAAKDVRIYGSYLDRERDNITFYPGEKNDYYAYTHLSEITQEGTRFVTTFTMGANFEFRNDDYPNQFSLYTILDEALYLPGYKNEEDIWDIMVLEGLGMNADQLASACTPEVITNYSGSGRTYIALHFDFGDKAVLQSSEIRAVFTVRVDQEHLKKSFSIPARSAVMINDSIVEYPTGKQKDAGSWGNPNELFSDIDRDGNAEETLAYDFDSLSYIYADSSHLQLTKYVKTTYSDGWTQLSDVPTEECGGIYQYKLYLRNGKSLATNIVVKDILETGPNMQWQGALQSVDLSECGELETSGTVYYSTSSTPSESLSSSDWTTKKPEIVKAVAVDFGADAVLKEGQSLNIIINMKAPEGTALKDKITENGFSASYTAMDSSTGNVTGEYALESNYVQVKLTPVLKSIVITKVDKESGAWLSGAKFALYDKKNPDVRIAEATSNSRGYAIFRQVPADGAYIIRELKAPVGYELITDGIEVTMNGADQRITVQDPRKPGRIEVLKVNSLDEKTPVKDAEYTLFDADGNPVKAVKTDADGLAVFTDVAWGKYTIRETVSPAGFQLNETEHHVEVGKNTVSETIVINTVDVQDNVSVRLNKYVSTTKGELTQIPLAGATFRLVRKDAEEDVRIGLYVTDTAGKIELSELPYGQYYFEEYRTPAGYITAENVEFTLSPENKDVSVAVYNQRKPGTLLITKKDNLGNLIEGVEFSLYDKPYTAEQLKEVVPVQVKKTDAYGVAQFENLEWGTYYVLEADAPSYYQMDSDWKEVTIDAKALTATLEVINETVKGTVTLVKTDEETGKLRLPGAEFTLYHDDGTVVGTYTTSDEEGEKKGTLTVENLEWGSYYFKEIKAPAGYSLSGETVRFSVNSLTAGSSQEIQVENPKLAKAITLYKRIKASDVNFDNGYPTFMFKVEGVDVNGEDHTYYRTVTFDPAYVKNNTDAAGYVTLSTTIANILAGTYTGSEMDTSRYYLENITDPVNGTVNGKQVVFDLSTDDKLTASAVFTNRNYEQQDFSDSQILTNVLKESVKLTALKVSYGADKAEAESMVDTSILEVIAIYDDGSVKTLTEDQYLLTIGGEAVTQFPNVNGDYTVKVSYTENGITRNGTFKVTLYGMKIRVIDLEVTVNDDAPLLPGEEIPKDLFTVVAKYNDGREETITDFVVSPSTAPSTEGDHQVTISLDTNVIPNDGQEVSEKVIITVKVPEPILADGATFKSFIPDTATSVVFTDETAPSTATLIDVSAEGNQSVVAWLDSDGVTFKVSTQKAGQKVIANESCYQMFQKKSSLTGIDFTMLDTSRVTTMQYMFDGCSGLTSLNLSNFNTANVNNMSAMFQSCSGLSALDLRSFKTGNVTTMSFMFYGCSNLADVELSSFTTESATNLSNMFYGCSLLTDISDLADWNVSNVTQFVGMFGYCKALNNIDALRNWTLSTAADNSINMRGMFENCLALTSLDALSTWNTVRVTNMSSLFHRGFSANGTLSDIDGISGWNVSNVTDFSSMFYNNSAITDLDDFAEWQINTSADCTVNMGSMFRCCTRLSDLDGIRNWNVSRVVDFDYMFRECKYLTTLDGLNSWTLCTDAAQNVEMTGMFRECAKLTDISALSNWNTSRVSSIGYLFYDCTNLANIDALKNWDVSNNTSLTYTFCGCGKLTNVDALSEWDLCTDPTKTITMYMTFNSADGLTNLDGLSKWNTSRVKDLDYAFAYCDGLTNIDGLRNWDTFNVTSLNNTFSGCYSLTNVDGVSNWNIINVVYLYSTFNNCTGLTSIDLSGWDLSNEPAVSTSTFGKCAVVTEALARTQADAEYLNSAHSFDEDGVWEFVSIAPVYTLKVNHPNTVAVTVPDTVEGGVTKLTVEPTDANKIVVSFKLDGATVEGNSFLAPIANDVEEVTVAITDVVFKDLVVIESSHYPHLNSQNGVVYGEATFDGATSLNVNLDYETEGVSWDWVYLYDKDGNIVNNKKYGGKPRKQEVITVPGNYVKITFTSDGSVNNYYGFRAEITANYD